jgi:hypothetical protein
VIELKLHNKDQPGVSATVEKPDALSAGVFLSGAIQSAIDMGGTLVIEASEKRT